MEIKKYTIDDIEKAFKSGANLRFFGSVDVIKEFEKYLKIINVKPPK